MQSLWLLLWSNSCRARLWESTSAVLTLYGALGMHICLCLLYSIWSLVDA